MTIAHQDLDHLYRTMTGKVLAYLVSLTKDLDVAEEIWHDTFSSALTNWPEQPPQSTQAWLFRVARNKAIDHLRHQKLTLEKSRLIQALSTQDENSDLSDSNFGDEQLKLIFACCHPALDPDKQIPLTLSTICGLTTQQIAEALVINTKTLEQRLTRAKRKLKQSGISFGIPEAKQLHDRIDSVLKTIYLVFNANDGELRHGPVNSENAVDMAVEALRLVKHLNTLLPCQAEVEGLQALMMFHLARRPARFDHQGDLVLLEDQDRNRWNRGLIEQADEILKQALRRKAPGSYQLQAAIQGVHCLSPSASDTDWLHIEALYHLLMTMDNNPVIKLNAAVATGMSRGMQAGLEVLKDIEQLTSLQNYSLLHATKANMLARTGHSKAAIEAYQRALSLTNKQTEKALYEARLAELYS